MRRLTRREYNNTIEDLLGDTSRPADAFDPDPTAAGFDNQVSLLTVSTSRARQYFLAAERLAQAAKLEQLSSCLPNVSSEQTCAEQFAQKLGQRAFRRPVEDAELAILIKVFAVARQGGDYETGLRQLLKALLVMPAFLYRLDVSPSSSAEPGPSRLGQYQLANRLSYTFLQSMPDDELFAAAAAQELTTPEQIASHVTRLTQSQRARLMSQDFYERWLGLGELNKLSKSAALFPAFDDEIRAALQSELQEFLQHSLWTEGGALASFFSASYGFRNSRLSSHYGDSAASGDALTLTMLSPERSAGILTTGGLMALLSTPEHTDPVRRGKFIRERFLCQVVPPPPPGVSAAFPEFEPGVTTRQRFATHQNDPVCAGCHSVMDGIGLGFENFDAVGVYRASENGSPVDASGQLVSSDIDGPFVGVRALAEKLATSQMVRDCMLASWFRFVAGREAGEGDAGTLAALRPVLLSAAQRSMLEALSQTPAYLSRRQEEAP